MILIDASVFLEVVLDQKKASESEGFLGLVSRGEIEAVSTHFSIHGVEAILGGGQSLTVFLRNVENSQGLHIYESTISDEISAAIMSEKIGRDFDDALQYFVSKKLGAEAIVSFDKHFDGLDIRRSEPAEILSNSRARFAP